MYGRRNSQPGLLLVMFIALELILSFVPFTQWLEIDTLVQSTLIFLPVVLAGALLGTGSGALLGLIAGVCRLLSASMLCIDAITSPLFAPFIRMSDGSFTVASARPWFALMAGLLPTIVAGLMAGLCFRALQRILRGDAVSLALAGAGGSFSGALVMWLCIWGNVGASFNEAYLRAALVNTGLEITLAAALCLIAGTPIYHRFVSND